MRVFWINTTNDCNLNCLYCYQKEKGNEHLDLNQIDLIINEIKGFSDQEIHINFFGGEPLINFPVIEKIVQELSKLRTKKIIYSMTTNLTILNKKIIDFIIKNNFRISVSIDGDETSYNSGRFKEGSKVNYHNIVLNNLKKFTDLNYP